MAIYVHESLTATELSDPNLRSKLRSTSAEQVWCQLVFGDKTILLGCIYRPPLASRTTEAVDHHVSKAISINEILAVTKQSVEGDRLRGICILDDFNFPAINWFDDGSASVRHGNNGLANLAYEFWETVNDLALTQCITEPTFVNSDGSSTNVLDLLLADNNERVGEIASKSSWKTSSIQT